MLDKCNLSKEKTGLAFRLEDTTVETADGPADTAFCQFEEGAVHKTADEVLQAEYKKQKNTSRVEEAMKWLEDILLDGSMLASKILEAAKDAGIKKHTVDRAKLKFSGI